MASDFDNVFEVLRGSVTEGRAENVRYRQNELYSLHSALRENAGLVCEAIAKDYAGSREKAETEFFLTMDAVRISYEKLDFGKSLEEEYSVKFGKDNSKRRAALGLVHIRPTRHSRFYSVTTPLVAALEAGNCVIVELDQSSPLVDGVLLEIIPKALDRDTFHISKEKIGKEYLSQVDFLVDQNISDIPSHVNGPHTTPQGRTVCILDRTGDLELAARIITSTRTSSGCVSPYSPDLVLVNEYLKDTFIARCLDFADQFDHSAPAKAATSEELEFQTLLRQAETEEEIVIHKRKINFTIVELKNRISKLATKKISGPYLVLSPATGIVDSVTSQRSSPNLLASYIFAAPSAAKFIAEQIPSHATYINQIPPQLLIGPPSLANHPHALHPRLTSDMFSTRQPQFIVPPTPLPPASKLMEMAVRQLKPTGQRPGHAIGFFEQGILLGLGSTALVVLPLLGWGVFRAVKFSIRYI